MIFVTAYLSMELKKSSVCVSDVALLCGRLSSLVPRFFVSESLDHRRVACAWEAAWVTGVEGVGKPACLVICRGEREGRVVETSFHAASVCASDEERGLPPDGFLKAVCLSFTRHLHPLLPSRTVTTASAYIFQPASTTLHASSIACTNYSLSPLSFASTSATRCLTIPV